MTLRTAAEGTESVSEPGSDPGKNRQDSRETRSPMPFLRRPVRFLRWVRICPACSRRFCKSARYWRWEP